MKKSYASVGGFLLAALCSQSAAAQSSYVLTGAELEGHAVRVDLAGGTTNTIHFDPGGVARIASASGREIPARWFVQNQSICLQTGIETRECWGYRTPFQAQQAVSLTSDCAATSLWTPLSTNAPPPVEVQQSGERG